MSQFAQTQASPPTVDPAFAQTQASPPQPAPTDPGQAAPSLASQLAQPGYLGTPATVAPSTYNPTGYGAQQVSTQGLDPMATIQQLLTGFAPQAQSAANNLNQTLANFGINGGQAVGAMSQLQAQLAGSLAPSIASAIQNSQGNILNAGEFNAGAGNQAGQFNAGASNTAGQFNAGAGNTASLYNAGATNATNAANVGQYNQTQEQLLQDIMNQYYSQQGAFNNINTGAQSAGNSQAVQYGGQVSSSDPFSAIFGPLMGAAGQIGGAALGAGGAAAGAGAGAGGAAALAPLVLA